MSGNEFDYVYFSNLGTIEDTVYYIKLRKFVSKLSFEYPRFFDWFDMLFDGNGVLNKNREIILCLRKSNIVGVAILKKSLEEKKICTLRVDRAYQRQGIGKRLVELSLDYLNEDKPLVTVHKNKKYQFDALFKRYGFKVEDEKWGYYKLFSTEISYNGALENKALELSRTEVEALIMTVKEAIFKNITDSEVIIKMWLNKCLYTYNFENCI